MLQADKIQLYSKKQNKTDIALNEKYKSMMLNGHNQLFFSVRLYASTPQSYESSP